MPRSTFEANNALPPLLFPDCAFDLVFAISVFTHLDEQYQLAWLAELRRVAQPGAILFSPPTVNGRNPG